MSAGMCQCQNDAVPDDLILDLDAVTAFQACRLKQIYISFRSPVLHSL